MRSYVLSRLGWGVVIILAILILNFLIVHMVPGDPLAALLGDFPVPSGYADVARGIPGSTWLLSTQLGPLPRRTCCKATWASRSRTACRCLTCSSRASAPPCC